MALKVLITGGLGNLGSWLTDHFVNENFDVTVLAKNKRPILSEHKFNYVSCDVADFNACKAVFKNHNYDVIIHAASVNDGFVDGFYDLALKVNALGTRNILEAIKDNPPKHFIYLSTFQVYGKYAGDITEETPLETKNDYGNSHLFAELYVKQFGFSHNLPFTIVRLTNSYGCPKDMNSSKWYLILNDLTKTAFVDKKIELKSNGKAPRDFIWMGDVCSVFEKLVIHGPTNDIYNVSGEITFRMLDIANFVQEAYFEKYGETLDVITNKEDKSEFPGGFSVSSSKLKKIIPYTCDSHFKEEAKKILDFLEANN